MAGAVVQYKVQGTLSTTAPVVVFDANVVAGSIIYVQFFSSSGFAGSTDIFTSVPTDNQGNIYTILDSERRNSGGIDVWGMHAYAVASSSGALTVTAHSSFLANYLGSVVEISGVAGLDGAGAHAQGQQTLFGGTDELVSGNMTTITDGDFLVSFVENYAQNRTFTAGTNWTSYNLNGNIRGVQYRTQAAAGSVQATATDAGSGVDEAVITIAGFAPPAPPTTANRGIVLSPAGANAFSPRADRA